MVHYLVRWEEIAVFKLIDSRIENKKDMILESEWILDLWRELKAGYWLFFFGSPCVYFPFVKGTSIDLKRKRSILSNIKEVVLLNDSLPVVNVDRLGRSIHYININ